MSNENFDSMPIINESRMGMPYILDVLFSKIYPMVIRIRNKIKSFDENLHTDVIAKITDVYSLCGSQIKKIILNVMDVFKEECHQRLLFHESHQFALERLSWCINRLSMIEQQLEKPGILDIDNEDQTEDSIFMTQMYFVNWIDHTFEVLVKLADVIYRTDYKESNELYEQWKNDMVECVTGLHTCVDELLLSAMTLCRHCLSTDQHIVKARCQVVLRETKVLLTELVQENPDATFKVTPDTLRLPIMPSNVNILIDVLKDVLYVLETNTNTALLALVVHCFSCSKYPVDVLRDHFQNGKGCACEEYDEGKPDDCYAVKEFDLFNERLLQIGSFAVSCSSDQSRILSLRSGLSSLEALDPHLVPAVMLSPNSHHAVWLMDTWKQEVQEIKDNIFLIVDPTAFAEKSKQMMHQILLEGLKEKTYNNKNVCAVINIASVVYDFFCVYSKYEPEALTHSEKLVPLLADLNKVQMECKIVSNILTTSGDFVYDIKQTKNNKEASIDQLMKRLKLLYTLVNKINDLIHPKHNDNQLFDDDLCDEEPVINNNLTRTVLAINTDTYVNSPRKPVNNISRSTFARTSNIRSSTNNFPLSKLTKHFKAKKCEELSFSVKLNELTDTCSIKINDKADSVDHKKFSRLGEPSMFFANSPSKARSSLRRAVLCKLPNVKPLVKPVANNALQTESFIDETMSLQITDVLNEISDLTTYMMSTSPSSKNVTRKVLNGTKQLIKDDCENVLTLDINNQNLTVSKNYWNIPVNANTVEVLDESVVTPNTSNMTQPSNVTTLERINDLNLVESKLSSLRSMQFETSL